MFILRRSSKMIITPYYNLIQHGRINTIYFLGLRSLRSIGIILFVVISNYNIGYSLEHNNHLTKTDTLIPSYTTNLGDGLSLELSATIALGSHGRGIGFNAITTYNGSAGSVSAGVGSTFYFSEPATRKTGLEVRILGGATADLGRQWGFGYYHTKFISGETSQHTGNLITSYKDWSFTFENDFIGDMGDRYRSHASVLSYKDFSLGLNIFTGTPSKSKDLRRIIEDEGAYGTYLNGYGGDDPDKYRLGLFYFRYKIFRLGTNSELIRHWTQNRLIHDNTQSPQFAIRDKKWRLYGGIYTYNPFTAW